MRKLNGLIIDGDEVFRRTIRIVLEQAGFTVEEAASGQEALEKAKQQRFTLVCCAYHLPDITGSDFCSKIRSVAGYDFSSVLVFAQEDNGRMLKQALLAGATDVFSKNDLDDLKVYLNRFVEREQRKLSGRVLFIEDSRVLQEIILDLLTDMGLDVDAYTHGEEAWQAFQTSHYDLVITDIMLEGAMSGISLVRKIRRLQGENGDIPIIATSGFDNLSRKIELFHLGVNDYVAKPIVREELRQRVFNHITRYQYMLELQSQQRSLHSLAMLDELTQLFNRHALREFSAKYFSEAVRFKHTLSLAVMDVDHFKSINKEKGHDVGDQVLAELGPWLKRFIRDGDLVARWSGEAFVFLLANCDRESTILLMERLQKRLAQLKPVNVDITVSIGIAIMDVGSEHNLNSLFELADGAMYQAKMAGRNCVKAHQDDSA
ncbi:MAG: diguanylate cyclase response regulator [Methylophaga sp.]|nr:MAG: diguanylate cyclase response regulator [Methylophaga sp.]